MSDPEVPPEMAVGDPSIPARTSIVLVVESPVTAPHVMEAALTMCREALHRDGWTHENISQMLHNAVEENYLRTIDSQGE